MIKGETSPMNYAKLLDDALKSLESDKTGFRPNEIAYLALTSKPEREIRDRLAFHLYLKLKQDGLLVSRECHIGKGKHADIAILHGDGSGQVVVEALIELKVYSFFNLDYKVHPKMQEKIAKNVSADFKKCRKYANEVFCLFLASNIEKEDFPSDLPYDDIVTSWKSWLSYKKSVKRRKKEKVKEEMGKFFKKKKWEIISEGEVMGGSAFNLEVSVPYWLLTLPAHGRS